MNLKHWVHRKLKAVYPFRPKKGTEKYRYRCPFCGFMVHSDRFLELTIPEIKADILVYGGYRGIRSLKPELSPDMRLKVLEAVKEKLRWLYEKVGGEEEWLKSRSASIRVVPNTSFLRTGVPSQHQRISVNQRSGMIKSVKSGMISSEKLTKLSM